MMIVGIDPGLTGACAVIDHNGVKSIFDLPTMPVPGAGPDAKVQRKMDAYALCAALLKHCPASEGKPLVVIEAVRAMGGKNNSIQTQASLLRTLGVVECLRFPMTYVPPVTWKGYFDLVDAKQKDSERKRASLHLARRLYAGCTAIAQAKDHNRAEALLLAHYGKVKLT
jgi:crossover junction endodeoxyribonuclease RuvC